MSEETIEETKEPEFGMVMVKNVPIELRRKFKSVCAANGVTMSGVLMDFMRSQVESV